MFDLIIENEIGFNNIIKDFLRLVDVDKFRNLILKNVKINCLDILFQSYNDKYIKNLTITFEGDSNLSIDFYSALNILTKTKINIVIKTLMETKNVMNFFEILRKLKVINNFTVYQTKENYPIISTYYKKYLEKENINFLTYNHLICHTKYVKDFDENIKIYSKKESKYFFDSFCLTKSRKYSYTKKYISDKNTIRKLEKSDKNNAFYLPDFWQIGDILYVKNNGTEFGNINKIIFLKIANIVSLENIFKNINIPNFTIEFNNNFILCDDFSFLENSSFNLVFNSTMSQKTFDDVVELLFNAKKLLSITWKTLKNSFKVSAKFAKILRDNGVKIYGQIFHTKFVKNDFGHVEILDKKQSRENYGKGGLYSIHHISIKNTVKRYF